MTINKIAKNLLEDKTCDNCKYKEYEQGEVYFCSIDRQQDSNPYLGTKPIPEENTCERWESIPEVQVNINITPFPEFEIKFLYDWFKKIYHKENKKGN